MSTLRYGIAVIAVAAVGVQFIQPERSNPPADRAASFETLAKPPAEVARVIGRACRDCHSNETVWPWYSRVAPMSWLVARHVREGRAKLNFSQWNLYGPEAARHKLEEICEEVKEGEMPPRYYLPLHPETRVTAAEAAAICSAAAVAPAR